MERAALWSAKPRIKIITTEENRTCQVSKNYNVVYIKVYREKCVFPSSSLEHIRIHGHAFYKIPGGSYRIYDKRDKMQLVLEPPHDFTWR